MCGFINAITSAVHFVKESKGQVAQSDMCMTLQMAFHCDGMTLLPYELVDTTVELYGAMVVVLSIYKLSYLSNFLWVLSMLNILLNKQKSQYISVKNAF